jgi:IS4 transposase
LVIVFTYKKGKWTHKNYFSTDLNLGAKKLIEYYRSRFQIEFLYRDAKQNTSLNHCQARSENKLKMHFNLANGICIIQIQIEDDLNISIDKRFLLV